MYAYFEKLGCIVRYFVNVSSDGRIGMSGHVEIIELESERKNETYVLHVYKPFPIEIRSPPTFRLKNFQHIDTHKHTLIRFDFQELTLDYFFSSSFRTHWRGVSVTSPFGLRQSKLEQLPKKNFHVVKNANRERTNIFICSKRLYNVASLYRQINRYCFNVEQRARVVGGEACLVLDWSFSRFDKKKKYRVPRYQRSLFHISVRWRWFMKSASRKNRDKSRFFSLSTRFK